MAHVRITARRPDGTVIDRQVEIRNDQRLEAALAKAWTDVLGTPAAARESPPGRRPPAKSVTLHAYDGPRVDPDDAQAAEAAAASRVIGRFVVGRATRTRREPPWYAADAEQAATGSRS